MTNIFDIDYIVWYILGYLHPVEVIKARHINKKSNDIYIEAYKKILYPVSNYGMYRYKDSVYSLHAPDFTAKTNFDNAIRDLYGIRLTVDKRALVYINGISYSIILYDDDNQRYYTHHVYTHILRGKSDDIYKCIKMDYAIVENYLSSDTTKRIKNFGGIIRGHDNNFTLHIAEDSSPRLTLRNIFDIHNDNAEYIRKVNDEDFSLFAEYAESLKGKHGYFIYIADWGDYITDNMNIYKISQLNVCQLIDDEIVSINDEVTNRSK